MIPVILDVDTGIDDALALLLAARHDALDLRAVTCVGGNVSLPQVVANTLAVLQLAGANTVPVAAGADRPLIEEPQDASYVHGSDGIGGAHLPHNTDQLVSGHAVELLRQTLTESAEPITLIALAPLTNIALLLRMHPEVAPQIARIVFMGGAIGAGNATASAEFNVWHDPEAAHIVTSSAIPQLMYGLEPFYRVAIAPERVTALGQSDDQIQQVVATLLTHLIAMTEDEARLGIPGGAAIGDAGAVAAVIDPAGITTIAAPIAVSLADPLTRGRTIVDTRRGLGAGGAVTKDQEGTTEVVIDVDAQRYADLFLTTIGADLA